MAHAEVGMLTGWMHRLASLKLTLVILISLGIGILVSYNSDVRTTWSLVVPLALFALNLIAAIATNQIIRGQTWLLIFHLALLAIILLVGAGRLTYLKGWVELSTAEVFDGRLTGYESGPWHWWRLDRVQFANEGFSIQYDPGPIAYRNRTDNAVWWRDENGVERRGLIGDHYPLVIHGYRIYTTFNKGFAPVFTWVPTGGGAPQRGSVHLPSYPAKEYSQSQEWELPGSSVKLWAMLQFDEIILDPSKPSHFRPPEKHRLVVRLGDERRELQPGQRLEIQGGVLVYEGLTTWMGYGVFSDWTIPWLLGACVVAVLSLSLHFWTKFRANPWQTSSFGASG